MRSALLALALCLLPLPAALRARQQLNSPAFLKGNPSLSVDFFFSQLPGGRTLAELELGGRFANIRLPKGARRAPRLEVSCAFRPLDGKGQAPLGRAGTCDLGEVLKNAGRSFRASEFGGRSPLTYQAELSLALDPGAYLVELRAADKGLGLSLDRTLRVTVPAFPAEKWYVGDLKFCESIGRTEGAGGVQEPLLTGNPWRLVGRRDGFPLLVAYELKDMPRDWVGRPLVHRFTVTELYTKKPYTWKHEEERVLGGRDSLEVFAMPPKRLRRFPDGVYLLLVDVFNPASPGDRGHSYKSFEVAN